MGLVCGGGYVSFPLAAIGVCWMRYSGSMCGCLLRDDSAGSCHRGNLTGLFGGFDVGVGSVHPQITHASVVELVSRVPGAGASFLALAAIIVGGFSLLLPSAAWVAYSKEHRRAS